MKMDITARLMCWVLAISSVIFVPQIAGAGSVTWGSGTGWTKVPTSSKLQCELKVEGAFRNYSTIQLFIMSEE